MGLTAIVLGAAAGGGFPQWNCNCDVCRLAWAGDPRVRAAHAGEPRCFRRRQALDPAQRLARSARANPGDASAASDSGLRGQSDRSCGADRRRDRPDRGFAEPARAIAVHADGDSRDTCCRRRQSDVRCARARCGVAACDRARREICSRWRVASRAVHGARQVAALSRRRQSGHRGGERRQCRRRDFRRQQARSPMFPALPR